MRIETLTLQNFRNVEDRTCRFDPRFTVLIGKNGSGKSSWLWGLRVACGAFFLGVKDVQKRHIRPTEIRKTNRVTFLTDNYPVLVEAKGYFPDSNEAFTWRRRQLAVQVGTTYSGHDVGEIRELGKSKYEQMLSGSERLNLPVIAYFGTARVFGAARNRQGRRLGREIFKEGYKNWDEMKSAVYGYEDWLADYALMREQGREHSGTLEAFMETLKAANPHLEDIQLHHGQLWAKATFGEQKTDLLPLVYHSDGVVAHTEMVAELAYRCIVLNGYLGAQAVRETHGVVMIDELDLHLHPEWQRTVVADLKRAFPNIQFVATTHSPFIVQSLNTSELINLDLNDAHEGLEKAPFHYGIEDVAEIEMGVEDVARSKAFKARVETATRYFELLHTGKTIESTDEIAALHQQLKDFEEKFSDDPAFVALLQAEKKASKL